MKERFASLVLVLSAAVCPDRASGQAGAQAFSPRVGAIFILGNTITKQEVIFKAIKVYPGTVLLPADLSQAEKDLEQLGLFAIDRANGIRPTVSIIGEGQFKDILVTVQETKTSRMRVMPGLSATGGVLVSVVWEERNFDLSAWPTGIDDLMGGRAFRGAGRLLRLELLQLPILPYRLPGVLRMGSFFMPVRSSGFPARTASMGK